MNLSAGKGTNALKSGKKKQKYMVHDYLKYFRDVVTRWNALKERLKNTTPEMEECSKVTTCFECEQKPGCGWCSSPNINRPARCSTKEQNEATCPPEGREKKYDEAPVVLKNHTDFEKSPRYAQLQPKHVEMRLNVGETKTLPFTYMFISMLNVLTHNLPDHIELKIFSNCSQGRVKEINNCTEILNGVTVKFDAHFRLKYCPKDASLWDKTYQIHNSQGESRDDGNIHVDLKLFCACSCDKHGTENICRNDRKVSYIKEYESLQSFTRLIWMSTLVRLKIHAQNACEQHPVTGVPARSIFIQMALHFQDVTEMTFLQVHCALGTQGLIQYVHSPHQRTALAAATHVLEEFVLRIRR